MPPREERFARCRRQLSPLADLIVKRLRRLRSRRALRLAPPSATRPSRFCSSQSRVTPTKPRRWESRAPLYSRSNSRRRTRFEYCACYESWGTDLTRPPSAPRNRYVSNRNAARASPSIPVSPSRSNSISHRGPVMRGAYAVVLLVALSTVASPARAQSVSPPGGDELNVADVVDRMNRAETALFVRLKSYHPLVEAYIQHLVPDQQLGWVPAKDDYFLGQFDFADRPRLRPLGQERKQTNRVSRWNPVNGGRLLPDGFAAMAAPDWKGLDRSRYQFTFVRREFLGEARTFVFDVRPLRNGGDGFSGRAWIGARDYTLIRFNGINQGTNQMLSSFFNDKRLSFHMDGWRVNVMPGVGLPSHHYPEETDLSDATSPRARGFRSQVRIWGYEAKAAASAQQLTAIHINEAVVDDTDSFSQLSPVMSQRRWEQEAEANVIERLEKIGLLAPAGEVDRVLETVL